MSEKIEAQSENTSQAVTTAIQYNEGSIMATARGDKFSTEVKQGFSIEDTATGSKFNIKQAIMLEIAEKVVKDGVISNLIRNGWEADGKMSAGTGVAISGKKDGKVYNCTFLESEMGKAFDKDKVQRKTFISLNAEYLDAIFTSLRFNNEVVEAKVEAMKLQRSTLNLG